MCTQPVTPVVPVANLENLLDGQVAGSSSMKLHKLEFLLAIRLTVESDYFMSKKSQSKLSTKERDDQTLLAIKIKASTAERR